MSSLLNSFVKRNSLYELKSNGGRRGGGGRGGGGRSGHGRKQSRYLGKNGPQSKSAPIPEQVGEYEKHRAARLVQRNARLKIARQRVIRRLKETFKKIFDERTGQYYYIDVRNGEKHWNIPPILNQFNLVLREQRPLPNRVEAAIMIQHMFRARQSRFLAHRLAIDIFEKRFDSESKLYYYIDSRNGAKTFEKPRALGKDDIEVESYRHRNAVCRMVTEENRSSSGLFVSLRGFYCILTDCTTLPNEAMAQTARAQFNFKEGAMSFYVRLRPDSFFLNSSKKLFNLTPEPDLDFALCALEQSDFAAAGATINPIRLASSGRKMECVMSIEINEPIEIVGHPHARLRKLYDNSLVQLIPNSIKPRFAHYSVPMETGASGSIVFNRAGRLVGIHHQRTMRDSTNECTMISAIISYIDMACMPPVPLLMSTCVGHSSINIYWAMPNGYCALNSLDYYFILEYCEKDFNNPLEGLKYEEVYRGCATLYTLEKLCSSTSFSIRCKGANRLFEGGWSFPLRVKTLPALDLSWRVKYCKTASDGISMMEQHQSDLLVHRAVMHWFVSHIDASRDDMSYVVKSVIASNGLVVLFESIRRFLDEHDHVVQVVYVLQALAAEGEEVQASLADSEYIVQLIDLRNTYEKSEELAQWILAAIGYICRDYEYAKDIVQVNGGIPIILETIKQFENDSGVVKNACYALAMLAHNCDICKQAIGVLGGLRILANVLYSYPTNPPVLYWACLTLGNLACGYRPNRTRAQNYGVVKSLTSCKCAYIIRMKELKHTLVLQKASLEDMRLNTSEDAGIEIEKAESFVNMTEYLIKEMMDENVERVADYALEHLMTEDHIKLKTYSKMVATRLLFSSLSSAFCVWKRYSRWVYETNSMNKWLNSLYNRKVFLAFRHWDKIARQQQPESRTSKLKKGLIINLSNKKRQKYRKMVLESLDDTKRP